MSADRTTRGPDAKLPLSGLRVLDLTLARAGPTCVRHLADWGADVVRIEPPDAEGGDVAGNRAGSDFRNLHRNKRCLQVDLKHPAGHAAFMRLLAGADVVVENMRPDVKGRLRVAWEDVHAANPRVVYGSISGFGQDGPYGHRAGVDQIAQGMGGLMSVTGQPGGGPLRVGIAIADMTAGTLLAFGIMAALHERTRTGLGRWVTTSLLEAQIFMLDFQAARFLQEGEVAGQAGNDHPTIIPQGVFPVSDGHINIAAASDRLWTRLCAALQRPDWAAHPGWSTREGRSRDRAAVNAAIAAVTQDQPAAHWVALLERAGIPCGPIYSIDQMFDDPQVRHLGVATPLPGGGAVLASPVNLSGVDKSVRLPVPGANEHTDAVLAEAGYDPAEIAALRAGGAVR